MINQKRYLAQIVIEADSPLKIGSGDRDLFLDSPIQKDWNGLPMILGTSITGVLRHSFKEHDGVLDPSQKGGFLNQLFGYQDKNSSNGLGSRLMISNAHLLDENMKVNEGLLTEKTEFLAKFDALPVREHTAITEKGVAKEHSKFDEEVVFKGSRFKFEIELISDTSGEISDKGLVSEIDNDEDAWEAIINKLKSPLFRLGSGTTKGFGKMEVISINQRVFDLDNKNDLKAYQNKSSTLNEWNIGVGASDNNKKTEKENNKENYTKYNLKITPDDFFMFGSGFGDDDADMTAVKEDIIEWNNNKGKFSEQYILMPAASIKGALSHRTAFHYNKLIPENKIDEIVSDIDDGAYDKIEKEMKKYTGECNKAVAEIFGVAKDSQYIKDYCGNYTAGSKGKILISDLFQNNKNQEKVFDHVKIDRFTGGSIEGALFQEKVISQKDEWNIEILLKKDEKDEIDNKVIEAFQLALKDITTGMLPLGGSTTKGHGVFEGKLYKNGEEI